MTTTTETPTTDEVIVGMLTENTGSHFLDSGGAYGRAWERNQGTTIEDWKARPEATLDQWGCYTLDVFHFLSDRLDYDPDLDALFGEFCDSREDTYWMQDMEDFPAWLAENHGDEYGTSPDHCTINTYNNEDALSQTLQFTLFTLGEHSDAIYGEFVLLQIHGGCDVRGGYTRPRVFRTCGEIALLDNARGTIVCSGPTVDENQQILDGVPGPSRENHVWDTEDAGYSWRDAGCSYPERLEDLPDLETLRDEDGVFHCPVCDGTLSVYGPIAG